MYKVKTAPTSEPVTLTEAKLHLKVDISDDDNLINALIKTAREMVENYCNRSLMPTVYEYYADAFLSEFTLNFCPVKTIDSIEYIALNGGSTYTAIANTNYQTDCISEPARVRFNSTFAAPALEDKLNAFRITYTAGYTDAASVPSPLKSAMLLIIGHLYDNREEVVTGKQVNQLPKASEYLMNPYRIFAF